MPFFDRFDLSVPLIQAPMAGVSTPDMAAAVSNAGALGSIGLGASDAATARGMIAAVRAQTDRPFTVNLFTHATPVEDAAHEAEWIAFLAPLFARYGAASPAQLRTIYRSLADDRDMVSMLLDTAPPVVSFHFGLPPADIIAALKQRGIALIATATNLAEAQVIAAAGLDGVVAQGVEAGGHRGLFDPAAHDDALSTFALTRLLVQSVDLPVIAAGGIMDGAGIAAALDLGAAAAQLGTAFIACPESAADAAYRAALASPAAHHTQLTALISGRPARVLANRFTALTDATRGRQPPDYPRAYDAGKALHAAASARGEYGFGAQWAGQGAPLARSMPAAELVAVLQAELEACRQP
ncbi:nitronate monooxygenase [Altererythrobacter xixiisoli]|uniref:Nitronate monooxygenase n=1 Tax=Croceibacterium xixiisoli TaxID=1476466 RepID=A0A6I4TTU6_9SPHN|nr:nitronate monooxygenase [Croceibacterium xixiisoli]MXO99324.1 nitronate monooxygenase [Croceibacterium xixiisoli]